MINGIITKIETVKKGPQPQDSQGKQPLTVEGMTTASPFFFDISDEAAEELVKLLAKNFRKGSPM